MCPLTSYFNKLILSIIVLVCPIPSNWIWMVTKSEICVMTIETEMGYRMKLSPTLAWIRTPRIPTVTG